MTTPLDSQQDNTVARPSSSDLKSSIALTVTARSTINKAPFPTHIEYEGENVNENPKRDNLSVEETLVNDREGLGGMSCASSFRA